MVYCTVYCTRKVVWVRLSECRLFWVFFLVYGSVQFSYCDAVSQTILKDESAMRKNKTKK